MTELRIDPHLIGQIQENMLAYFRLFASLPGISLVDDDAFWLVSARGEPGNQILRARFPANQVEARIDGLLAQIGQYVDQIDWMVFPGCQPADLGARLATRGMVGGPGGIWMTTALPAQPSPLPYSERFRIEQVRSLSMLEQWRQISAAGFGSDVQMHADAYACHGFADDAYSLHYIGYLDDQAVTSATLLLAGGIAGLWDVSTPPALRGRGFGSLISQHLLDEAQRHGYHQAWVWSSRMGQRVYQRVGFIAADFGVREYQWHKQQPGSAR